MIKNVINIVIKIEGGINMSNEKDITVDIADHKLNVRAAGIIIHNGKVLVHKNINETYYALIGGRVQVGESSADTVIREIFEELGKKVEITGYVATIENFFGFRNSNYHEILFVHRAEFIENEDKKIEETIKNIEGREFLQYEWLDLDKIDEYEIRPAVMKKVLKEKNWPVHVVNDDR